MNETEMGLFIPIIELLLKEQEKKSIHQEEILRSYLNILLMQSNRFYISKNPESLPITNHSVYNRFRILLEKNFTRLHKVKEYAELLNTTEKTLNEHTKKITGKTASDQIYDRIILEAKRLLRHSDLSTKEIAFFLNYQDPAHFNKFFRTQTGKSPGEFKEQNG
jgi:AraC-like DNA-binding protein